MKRLRNCPGSLARSRVVPNVSSAYALEGQEAHALAYNILEARRKGKLEPDTFGHTEEFLEAIYVYVEHVNELAQRKGAIQLLEHRFDLNEVYPGCFGTVDAVTYIPSDGLLVVTDYKHGGGVFVDVERNDQLMYYALGAVKAFPQWKIKNVRLEIVQPRYTGQGDLIRTYNTTLAELKQFEQEVKDICKATEDPHAPLAAGDWCQFCPVAAADACPLLKQERKTLARRIFQDLSIQEVNIEELAKQMRWIPVFQKQFEMMKELAYQLAMKGQTIPGYKLVDKRPSRDWKDKDEAACEIYDRFGIKINKLVETYMSPSQVELLPKSVRGDATKNEVVEFIADHVSKTSSGLALVPEYDDRDNVKKIEAKTVFTSAVKFDVFD